MEKAPDVQPSRQSVLERLSCLTSEAYKALTEVTRAGDRIYCTYGYQQNAY